MAGRDKLHLYVLSLFIVLKLENKFKIDYNISKIHTSVFRTTKKTEQRTVQLIAYIKRRRNNKK